LAALRAALNDNRIERVPGLGNAVLARIRGVASDHDDALNDARAI
jgi:hypothetical protein